MLDCHINEGTQNDCPTMESRKTDSIELARLIFSRCPSLHYAAFKPFSQFDPRLCYARCTSTVGDEITERPGGLDELSWCNFQGLV